MWRRFRILIESIWVAHLLASYIAVFIAFTIAVVCERPFHWFFWFMACATAPLSFIPFAVLVILSRAEGDRSSPLLLAVIYLVPMTTLSTIFYRWSKP